jgi:hypothetical protein
MLVILIVAMLLKAALTVFLVRSFLKNRPVKSGS